MTSSFERMPVWVIDSYFNLSENRESKVTVSKSYWQVVQAIRMTFAHQKRCQMTISIWFSVLNFFLPSQSHSVIDVLFDYHLWSRSVTRRLMKQFNARNIWFYDCFWFNQIGFRVCFNGGEYCVLAGSVFSWKVAHTFRLIEIPNDTFCWCTVVKNVLLAIEIDVKEKWN